MLIHKIGWKKTGITNKHYYSFDCFNVIVNIQIAEFNDHFNEVNLQLLICMDSLNLRDSFGGFDPLKLMKLIEFYPNDFWLADEIALEYELIICIDNVKVDERFDNLNDISDFSRMLVETKKYYYYALVDRLVKLSLVLFVATAIVDRCFSVKKLGKLYLRNRICDYFLTDCLILLIE